MKILHIITKSELGGAQSVVINIANTLCSKHEITVIAGEGDRKMFDALDSQVNKIYYPHLRRAISPINDLKTLLFLRKQYRKIRPDVIHLHSSKAGLLGRLILPCKKIVFTIHGFDSIRVAHRRLITLERIMQKRCAYIIGVSQYDTSNLHSAGITRNTKLNYNGVSKSITDAKLPIEIPHIYKKTVMCIARVAKPKRHDLFIECARQLPEYAFVWIGNIDPIDTDLPNLFFIGNLPNASAYCKYADLFMLPSDYEGLPVVLLEAMSHGKPIVASKVGGVPEIVFDGKNGFALPNDVDAFTEKISCILRDESLLKSFSDYSYQLYENRFTADKMVNNYLNIYHKICHQ